MNIHVIYSYNTINNDSLQGIKNKDARLISFIIYISISLYY